MEKPETPHAAPIRRRVSLRVLAFASLALNLFLLAFILGRFTAPGMMMPPLPFGGHRPPMPPFLMGSAPPPPPFMMLQELFTPEEMEREFARVQSSFAKTNRLREEFAGQLMQGPVTTKDVLAHFEKIEQEVIGVLRYAQSKVAEKLSAMPEAERKAFAQKLRDAP